MTKLYGSDVTSVEAAAIDVSSTGGKDAVGFVACCSEDIAIYCHALPQMFGRQNAGLRRMLKAMRKLKAFKQKVREKLQPAIRTGKCRKT